MSNPQPDLATQLEELKSQYVQAQYLLSAFKSQRDKANDDLADAIAQIAMLQAKQQ